MWLSREAGWYQKQPYLIVVNQHPEGDNNKLARFCWKPRWKVECFHYARLINYSINKVHEYRKRHLQREILCVQCHLENYLCILLHSIVLDALSRAALTVE
jgi:hypothetical protein